jgi:two-component system NtrC family response regulator
VKALGDSILVVDDEPGVRHLLKKMLELRGYAVATAADAGQALKAIEKRAPNLVITDLRMPGMPGEKLVAHLKAAYPAVPVVVLSAHGDPRAIVEVIKSGAEDYLAKPFAEEDLELVVLKALEKHRLLLENERLRRALGQPAAGAFGLVGSSALMRRTVAAIQRIAQSGGQVLVSGESGTGKELAARALHTLSPRSRGPYVDVNAGAIPSALFEAELFGAKRGAYTGAEEDRSGLFVAADGGTLFLDEVGEIPLETQAKLLRVLETGELRPLGESRARAINVRVVAATNRDLLAMCKSGQFRKDLYYRLSVIPLRMPALREHLEDLPELVAHFLGQAGSGGRAPRVSAEAMRALMRHDWQGNVRELKNVLERARAFAQNGVIEEADLVMDFGGQDKAPASDLQEAKKANAKSFELQYLTGLLKANQGNVSKSAKAVNMDRRNFHALLRRHALDPARFKQT